MKFLLLASLSLFVDSASAKELSLSSYIRMQEALAADDFKSALDSHKQICAHKVPDYKDCNKSFKDIEELRNSFKTLSTIYLDKGDKKEIQELQKATCPMAAAKWIQKKGDLRNPYYGKSMLECGEKI